MILQFTRRMLTEIDKRLLFKFVYNFGWKGMKAVNHFNRRLKRGVHFPAFLFLSITNNCNLKCQGCWVSPTKPARELDLQTLNQIINEAKKFGSYFYGILGGEPLMYPKLIELFKAHPDCYFLLFTNGTLLNEENIEQMHQAGNVSPLISIEGNEVVSDERRGGKNVFSRSMQGLDACIKRGLITGVATSVCKSNIDDLANEKFVHELVKRGVHYLWYYIYRPVGPQPTPELILSEEQVIQLRKFMVDIRSQVPMLVVDSYWDHEGKALCPAAVGIGHHINSNGDVELCPPIQFAKENIKQEKNLETIFRQSTFIKAFREKASEASRGCIIMENPELLKQIVVENGAYDSSRRNSALQELSSILPCTSHAMAGHEIPEKYWVYKFAKKNWFWGFGAYG